jgi:hypothetical protein
MCYKGGTFFSVKERLNFFFVCIEVDVGLQTSRVESSRAGLNSSSAHENSS